MSKKYKDLANKAEAASAAYHEAATQDTVSQKHLAKLQENIKSTRAALSGYITEGAKADKDAVLVGTKKRPGVWEIFDLTSGRRARGEDREEAVDNWNAGAFYEADPNASPVGKVADLPAEDESED